LDAFGITANQKSQSLVPIDALRFPTGSLRLFAGILDFG
jgi:hypothetical protein